MYFNDVIVVLLLLLIDRIGCCDWIFWDDIVYV